METPTWTWASLRDRAVYEDDDTLVLDKPSGISVMGERHDTDLTQLAAEAGEEVRWVHRIDKVTSGVVVLAKHKRAHGFLTKQFAARTVDKSYLAVTSSGLEGTGTIDLPLGVGRKNRVRIGAAREAIAYDEETKTWKVPDDEVHEGPKVYPSVTHYRVLHTSGGNTLLRCDPVTGRRHQIRVHLAWCGFALVGDPLFDKTADERGLRCCLHSWQLTLDLPCGRRERFRADPGSDFWNAAGFTYDVSALA